MKKIWSHILSASAVLCSLILILITLGISLTIFLRFVDITMPGWVVQFAEYGLFWMPLLGAAWLLQRGRHVNVDLLITRLGSRSRLIVELLHTLLGITVCGILFWYSVVVVWEHYQRRIIDIQVIDMPQYAILLVLPVGFLMLSIQFGIDMVGVVRNLRLK